MVPNNDNNPIVITAQVAKFDVKRILIDNGSVVEILSFSAFQAMGLKEKDLRSAKPIRGFANQPIKVVGQVSLPVTIG